MRWWHRWKWHAIERITWVEYAHTGYDVEHIYYTCACGKVWPR